MDNLRDELILKFKEEVIESCGVLDVEAQDFSNDSPLFGSSGLNLDSLDALELIVLIEQNFDVKIKGKEGSNHIFKSFNAIADHIFEKAPEDKIKNYVKS